MNELKIFENEEFGRIRAVEINGEPWLVGKDVAAALGYSNPRDALAKHVDDEDKDTVAFRDGTSGNPNQTIINESGLYAIVMASKLPGAKKFRRWVTSEVIPSIRKHGTYMTPETIEKALLNPDFIIKLAGELKSEQEKRRALEAKVEADAPAVAYAKDVSLAKTAISVERFAKHLFDTHGIKMGRNRMFRFLREMEILKEDNLPYQKYLDAGWFQVRQVAKNGRLYSQTLICGKGQQKLYEMIKAKYFEGRTLEEGNALLVG